MTRKFYYVTDEDRIECIKKLLRLEHLNKDDYVEKLIKNNADRFQIPEEALEATNDSWFRKLNEKAIIDSYPLPNIFDINPWHITAHVQCFMDHNNTFLIIWHGVSFYPDFQVMGNITIHER